MANFETIVRPVVFPSIRPQPPRVLPAEDDPTQGICQIAGGGGSLIDLNHTSSVSISRSPGNTEVKRVSDEVKIKQEEDDGTINPDNYVKVKVAKGIRIKDMEGNEQEIIYRPADEADNIELIRSDIIDTYTP